MGTLILGIGSLDFPEFWQGAKDPYEAMREALIYIYIYIYIYVYIYIYICIYIYIYIYVCIYVYI